MYFKLASWSLTKCALRSVFNTFGAICSKESKSISGSMLDLAIEVQAYEIIQALSHRLLVVLVFSSDSSRLGIVSSVCPIIGMAFVSMFLSFFVIMQFLLR